MSSVTLRCYAKVNLFLRVGPRRPDGYHEVRTVMQTISLHDRLTLRPRPDGAIILCDDPAVPTDERNLCARAIAAIGARIGKPVGVEVRLTKRVPMGAGLGGGSSDAAATLAGLNALLGSPLSRTALREAGAEIGADVPFFLAGGAALATGVGERLTQLPSRATLWLVLAKPQTSMDTAEAYRLVDRVGAGADGDEFAVAHGLETGDVGLIASGLGNGFWPAVSQTVPEVATLRTRLLEAGALGACLTGSGTCVFGLFESADAAERGADVVRSAAPFVASAAGVAVGHEAADEESAP
ncbi:MAG: 4-(cytidine 5'-diphospho)-2-C-methyl-D-erythritol kinase [Armatimonadota bacterium]